MYGVETVIVKMKLDELMLYFLERANNVGLHYPEQVR